jgi:protein gp37
MSLNKSKIEWCDWSWNPITGCERNCYYCYARKMFHRFGKSFKPEFHRERLNDIDKIKKPCKVFVCSVSDLFAPWTSIHWQCPVFAKLLDSKYKHITFQLLTKSPEGIPHELHWPGNIWMGVTINHTREVHKAIELIAKTTGSECINFISFEPILEDIMNGDGDPHLVKQWNEVIRLVDWVIVGKLTGSNKVPLQKIWVQRILDKCRELKKPIFIKNNVGWETSIQEYPNERKTNS